MAGKPIRVLIVEDSPVTQELLAFILESDPQLQVIARAADGEEAVRAVERLRPDVVTMDIHMPKLDGIEATRQIMQTVPLPIVIVSTSTTPGEVATTFKAMDAGAVAVVEKPPGPGHPGHAEMAQKMVETVRLMSEVRVIRRWRRKRVEAPEGEAATVAPALGPAPIKREADIRLIAVGTSTGGPQALQALLQELPAQFPVPILIVQHITAGFLPGMVQWLNNCTQIKIKIADEGERPLPGHAYLAPDAHHMGIYGDGRILLSKAMPESGLRPAVSFLFRSTTEVLGARVAGVLLTGMGKDGAQELRLMHDRGAVTLAQDAESSVIHGMPGEAIALGAADYILPPARIASTLAALTGKG